MDSEPRPRMVDGAVLVGMQLGIGVLSGIIVSLLPFHGVPNGIHVKPSVKILIAEQQAGGGFKISLLPCIYRTL